jgi:hypothetical protein
MSTQTSTSSSTAVPSSTKGREKGKGRIIDDIGEDALSHLREEHEMQSSDQGTPVVPSPTAAGGAVDEVEENEIWQGASLFSSPFSFATVPPPLSIAYAVSPQSTTRSSSPSSPAKSPRRCWEAHKRSSSSSLSLHFSSSASSSTTSSTVILRQPPSFTGQGRR